MVLFMTWLQTGHSGNIQYISVYSMIEIEHDDFQIYASLSFYAKALEKKLAITRKPRTGYSHVTVLLV